MIYRVPGNNEPYKEEGKIYYDEADMNRKFEEFLYNTCRGTDFGKLKNDNTVKVQCQMVRKHLGSSLNTFRTDLQKNIWALFFVWKMKRQLKYIAKQAKIHL